MAILEWEKRFELGVNHFDEDHKRLVALLNEVYDNINDGVAHDALGAVIVELIDYATYHFAAEENSMASNGYAGLQLHREEHVKFCHMVVAFQHDFNDGNTDFSFDILSFLGNWLFDHILHTDAEYCQFVEHLKMRA